MPSLKKNFLYSSFLTTANYIFPLITFPYATRVLGVHNIGIVSFVDGIINYFIILSAMGIGILGVREIAQVKNDKEQLTQVFSSLICLNAVFTFAALVILAVATLLVPRLAEHSEMMLFGGFKLLFNFLLIEWVYKGLENFKFITVRTLIVKCLYVVSVFVFVRKESDYNIFYLLTVLMIGINAVINTFYVRNFTGFRIRSAKIRKLFKPMVTLGLYMILTSMYTTFNVVYLGFVSNDTQVGYYSTATKLYTAVIAIFTAFTGVMMPRMSSLVKENRLDEFKKLFAQSVEGLLSISMPVIFFSIALSSQLVLLIAGPGYEGAVLPMAIVMPLFLIIGYEQILVIQVLMPLSKDDVILRNSICAAVVGVLLNIIIVPSLQAVGSTIVWVVCEFVILILSQIAVTRLIAQVFPYKLFLKNLLLNSPLVLLSSFASILHASNAVQLAVCATIAFLYFIAIQYLYFREGLFFSFVKRYVKKLEL